MQKFLYNRSDFRPLPVKLEHMDIYLNFLEGKVEGTNTLRMTAREPLDSIRLDARDLEVHSVECSVFSVRCSEACSASGGVGDQESEVREENFEQKAAPLRQGYAGQAKNAKREEKRTGGWGYVALDYDYRKEKNVLVVKLPERVEPGTTFSVRTKTACVPSDHILEGIYKDTTPPGCPQQYMSQCQQWGFQRITPVFDDCTAKCTMVTTIEADATYTHLISNGNISRKTNPAGKPVLKAGDRSRKIITYENFIPMAPYLFIVAVGTWDTLEDEVVYPSGRRVKLEYLVPRGRTKGAVVPMKILKESVLWQGRTQDYEYERDVYRTICMEKSNFGGMENVGNTTIITDAAMIDEYTGDGRLVYAHGVIAHEYEHNQCGSDVTMETPFDMWLNEAFTVDVDRQFLMSQFDPDCTRLDEIDSMRAPIGGPLAVEDAGHFGNIVREGFNDPDELVDGVTYVKAAEVIRMLRLILGRETFRKGKNLYFTRHKGANANTDQFFKCFEEVSGRDLSQFKREWLYTIGYPKIEAACRYVALEKRLQITLRQTRSGAGGLFHVPIELAAVDEQGLDIPGTAKVVEMTGGEAGGNKADAKASLQLTFDNVPEPAFISFNRDCSFYGTFTDSCVTPEQLLKQIRLDPNRFNRVEAMRRLTDIERVKLIKDINAGVGEQWLETFAFVLRDMSLPPGLKAYLLRIDEQSLDRKYLPWYRERYAARIKLLKTVAERYADDLVKVYRATDTYKPAVEPKDGVEERKLKATLLRIIVEANTPAAQNLAEDHFRKAWHISDKMAALACVNLCDHPRRTELLEEGYDLWRDHLSAYTSYLGIISSGIHDDVFEMIAREEKRPTFAVQHPGHSRSLFLPMTANNKMLWTDRGINWVKETAIRMTPINENTTIRLVACFQQVNKLAPDLKPMVIAALEAIKKTVDPAKFPSVAGRINTYLGE